MRRNPWALPSRQATTYTSTSSPTRAPKLSVCSMRLRPAARSRCRCRRCFGGTISAAWLTASAYIGCSTAPAKPDKVSCHGHVQSHTGDIVMRFMILVKATKDSEAGVMPSKDAFAEMGRYNEELAKAGILLAAEGLHPTSKGVRVRFSGTERTVIEGPFADPNELVAGFWLWQVNSREEDIEWVKRCPNPMPGDSEIEIRQVYEADDFGAEFTPELREQEERLRAQIAGKA